jgi:DeoR/GlpR family transcriptional regulator of sugar metabolism
MTMIQSERHRQIAEMVHNKGSVTTTELCEMFDVSEMTIRRDLRELDREGLLRRVHGGAVSSLGRSYEPPYQVRAKRQAEAKSAIGKAAADLIAEGDSIALDVGTTTLEIARQLHDKHNLTIITASLPIANEIVSNLPLNSGVRLILTGGIVRAGEFSMIGHIAEETYRQLHVDKAFIGIGGLSIENGLTEYNLEDALVKRPLLRNAQQRIVVVDSSKLGQTTFAAVGDLSMIDMVITDANASSDFVDQLYAADIQVIIAE